MGRRHDEERTRQSRQSRPRRYDARNGGGYDYGPYYDRKGDVYFEDSEGYRQYRDGRDDGYDRDRDREREYYYREREQRQETKRTGLKVLGVICVALIALFGVMVFTAQDPSQTGQVPQQAPQQAPEAPQAPAVPENPASQELPPRERWVVKRYYGLDGRPPATLREIAREMGVVY